MVYRDIMKLADFLNAPRPPPRGHGGEGKAAAAARSDLLAGFARRGDAEDVGGSRRGGGGEGGGGEGGASSSGDAECEAEWTVQGTKKGGLPIKVETRRNGKKVVMIEHVSGDLDALLSDMKCALGTGGVARPEVGTVEVQGGHHEKAVRDFLNASGRLTGVNKKSIAAGNAAKGAAKSGSVAARRAADGRAELTAKSQPPPSKKVTVDAEKLAPLDSKRVKAMKPPELKAQLLARGESAQGNKKELLKRLLALNVS
jgi:translation initiation factor 1 (eIF-1/SUI1)